MTYKLELSRTALKALKPLPKTDLKKIWAKLEKLKEDPYPHGNEKLAGADSLYRIRYGHYRIIYEVHNDKLLILVLKIGHRREVYQFL